MKILANLVFEFLRKTVLFSFWFDKNYTTFIIVLMVNENMIIKYIIFIYQKKEINYFLLN